MPKSEVTLTDLAFMYNTDKHSHGYMDFYEKHLPKNPRKLLEIGVLHGRSIQMWQKHFPDCEIHGLDLFEADPIPDIPGVKFWKGNQCDQYVLEQIRREHYDCIVEDASHNCVNHWVTLFSLIGSCDYYFIEDLFTCSNEFYSQGLSFEDTVLGKMKSGKFPFNFILHEDKIAMIWK